MNALFVLIFTCGGALAIGRGLDLALWTDWNTGLCTAGSVWLRYGGLWAALVVGIIAARKLARQPLVLRSACRPVGVTSVLGGVCVGLAGAVRLAVGMTGVGALVRAVLELVCAVWLIRLGRSWTHKGEYRLPGRSMTPAVLGTAVFYWGVLSRFMENSSSWHRVEPTAMVWQMLAALVFLSAMARALSPSPSVMPTMALPPVPSIKPTVPTNMGTGMMRLTAAKAVLPTKFETHRPSTMP